jgi:hypothetical protein
MSDMFHYDLLVRVVCDVHHGEVFQSDLSEALP